MKANDMTLQTRISDYLKDHIKTQYAVIGAIYFSVFFALIILMVMAAVQGLLPVFLAAVFAFFHICPWSPVGNAKLLYHTTDERGFWSVRRTRRIFGTADGCVYAVNHSGKTGQGSIARNHATAPVIVFCGRALDMFAPAPGAPLGWDAIKRYMGQYRTRPFVDLEVVDYSLGWFRGRRALFVQDARPARQEGTRLKISQLRHYGRRLIIDTPTELVLFGLLTTALHRGTIGWSQFFLYPAIGSAAFFALGMAWKKAAARFVKRDALRLPAIPFGKQYGHYKKPTMDLVARTANYRKA
jgi:hypothetical protein